MRQREELTDGAASEPQAGRFVACNRLLLCVSFLDDPLARNALEDELPSNG